MFKDGLLPTLVGVITTVDDAGVVNAAPVTWFAPISYEPPMIAVALKSHKQSIANVRRAQRFVLQTVRYEHAQQVHNMAVDAPVGVSEPALVGLDVVKGLFWEFPRLAIAEQWFACCFSQEVATGSETHTLILGTVLKMHTPTVSEGMLLYYGGLKYGPSGSFEEVRPY